MLKQTMVALAGAVAVGVGFGGSAEAALLWNWSFGGADGLSEQGTFTTNDGDTSDPDTIYEIIDFSVTQSGFGAPLGSNSDGTYSGPLSGGGNVFPSFRFLFSSQSPSPFLFQPNPLDDFSYYTTDFMNLQYEYQFLNALFAPEEGGIGVLKTQPGNLTLTNGVLKGSLTEEPPKSVPEPASLLGFAAVGAVAAGGALKKKAAA